MIRLLKLTTLALTLLFTTSIAPTNAAYTSFYTNSPGFGTFQTQAWTTDSTMCDQVYTSENQPFCDSVKAYSWDSTNGGALPPNPTFMLIAQRSWLWDSRLNRYLCMNYAAAWRGIPLPNGVSGPGSDIWTRRSVPSLGVSVSYITTVHLVDNYAYAPHWSGSADGIGYTAYLTNANATYDYWNGFRPYDGACDCPGRSPRKYGYPNVPEVHPTC
ncbi:MAG: hypothetical protein SF029_18070 [bacterium]|nr:hypothetical protein [bacterium]